MRHSDKRNVHQIYHIISMRNSSHFHILFSGLHKKENIATSGRDTYKICGYKKKRKNRKIFHAIIDYIIIKEAEKLVLFCFRFFFFHSHFTLSQNSYDYAFKA